MRIHDKRIAEELLQMLNFQLRDTVNAREMQPDGSYQKVKPAQDASRVDSQLGMYERLADAWPKPPAEKRTERTLKDPVAARRRVPAASRQRARREALVLQNLRSLFHKKQP